ncbi:MAG: hypothetical protein INF16_02855 [Methylobacterium sp.]|jgi:thiamine pyrophosphate-dependent acetolactate synthase large subunit-like protein|nr:hypothetical protein [Methylobacterium sp.]MCA3641202.1 hypothetical protein [Methylobacterium sp.]
MPNGADILAERLAAQGCCIAFGLPGGEVLARADRFTLIAVRIAPDADEGRL